MGSEPRKSSSQKSFKNDYFEGKFKIELLKKAFHGLWTIFFRELKNSQKETYPKNHGSFIKVCFFSKKESVFFSMEERH